MFQLNIVNIIGSEFAVSPEDGNSIFDIVKEKLENKEKISIDFSNVDIMTTAFLNNAIGKLYKTFEKDVLNSYITMINISESDLKLVKKVIERAKITFSEEMINELEEEFEGE